MIEVTLHNAHDILGVEKNATEAAIKKVVAYFNLDFLDFKAPTMDFSSPKAESFYYVNYGSSIMCQNFVK